MSAVAAMIVKEWKLLLRDPGALALLFVMPSVFIFVFSLALQGVFSRGGTDERLDVLVIDESGGAIGERLSGALEESGHFRAVTASEEANPAISIAIALVIHLILSDRRRLDDPWGT